MKSVTRFLLAVVCAAALAAGCSSTKSDQALTTDIQARMFADPQVKAANISVSVKNGEATLTGNVPNEDARYQAFKIATDTPGVKHVVDQMTMEAAQAAATAETPAAPANPRPAPAVSKRESKREREAARKEAKRHAKSNLSARTDPQQAPPEAAPAPAPAPVAPPAPIEPVAAPAPQPPPAPAPPQPTRVEIPAGTSLRIQMIDPVDSTVNHTGDTFHASLLSPIVVDNQVVVPSGTDITAKLVNAKSAGHMTGQSELALELVRMEFAGRSYALATSEYTQKASSRSKRTAETVGGGAVLGALLGAVIGGGKGAAIGAASGAGAGGVAQEVTKAQQVRIPSEAKLDFSLEQPVRVSYFPDQNGPSRQ
jgi:BON domain/YMGG-like Gly-zipper